jgi:adenosylhomocysteine nucleosidase
VHIEAAIRWVVALSCEAMPVREHFRLQRVEGGPFAVYRSENGRHWLVESGVGRSNAAAAVMHLHHVSDAPRHAAWINLGVAGHRDIPLGDARLVNQITERSTGRTFYPIQVFEPPLPRGTLTTVDRAAEEMSDDALYDMEGSAFMDVASRVSCPELVALIKLVSDHGITPGEYPERAQVSAWVMDQLDAIVKLVEGLEILSQDEGQRRRRPAGLDDLLSRAHFTVSQRHQANELLRRWSALAPAATLDSILGESKDSKTLLGALTAYLDDLSIDWRQR